jgi:hypothetical protein
MAADKLQLDATTIGNVILHLNHVCLAPGMYFGNPTLFQAMEFWTGFRVAIDAAFDATILRECRNNVVAVRGYKTPCHWYHDLPKQIQDRFPEEANRAIEFLGLELEAWKRLRELTH